MRSSHGGMNSAESSLAGSGQSFGLTGANEGGQGVFNLQKIQHDLMEIQSKLTKNYKAGLEHCPPSSPLKPWQQGGGAAAASSIAPAGTAMGAAPRLLE